MGVHYSNGSGYLHDRGLDKSVVDDIQYYLRETDPSKYAAKKWWGGLSTKQEIARLGNYQIEFQDGRRGTCSVVNNNTPLEKDVSRRYHYLFYGRGRLGGGRRSSRRT